ncbi:hypothetical protein D3C78_1546950 [compost metagenome]
MTKPVPCGSELARDSGMSVHDGVDWIDAIASKLAPTETLPDNCLRDQQQQIPAETPMVIPLRLYILGGIFV